MKKIIIATVLSALCFNTIFGQELNTLVPSEIYTLTIIDLDKINQKTTDLEAYNHDTKVTIDSSWTLKLPEIVNGFNTLSKEFIMKSYNNGINQKSKVYFYTDVLDSVSHSVALFSLTDAKKFEQYITQGLFNSPIKVEKGDNGLKKVVFEELVISWDKTKAAISSFSLPYNVKYSYYSYDESYVEEVYNENESYEQRLEREEAERVKKEAEKREKSRIINSQFVNASIKHVYAKKNNPISTQSIISKKINLNSDIFFAMNTDFQSMYKSYLSYGSNGSTTKLPSLDNQMSYTLINFDKTAVNIDNYFKPSNETMGLMDKMSAKKLNPKMNKYISKNNLGYLSTAYDMPSLMEYYKLIYTSAFSSYMTGGYYSNSERREKTISLYKDMYEVFFILLDEDEIYDMFQGDFVMTFDGYQNVDVEYTSYEYDTITWDYSEVTKTRNENIPVFSSFMTTMNEKLVQKIFDIMVHSDAFEKKGDMYESKVSSSFPIKTYAAYKDGILAFSNAKNFSTKTITDGYKESDRVEASKLDEVNQNSIVFNFDLASALKTYIELPKNELKGRERKEMTQVMETFQQIHFVGAQKINDEFKSELKISTNPNKNSLELILDYMSKMIR